MKRSESRILFHNRRNAFICFLLISQVCELGLHVHAESPLEDVRAQKFPCTDFFKTLTARRK